jgi:hypothetical protein
MMGQMYRPLPGSLAETRTMDDFSAVPGGESSVEEL